VIDFYLQISAFGHNSEASTPCELHNCQSSFAAVHI